MITINSETKKELAGLQQVTLFKGVLLESNKDPIDYYPFLFEKGSTFLNWYISYSVSILNGKGYSDKRIAEMLLTDEFHSKVEEKEFSLKHF